MKVKTLLEALKGVDENLDVNVSAISQDGGLKYFTVEVSTDKTGLNIVGYSSPISEEERIASALLFPLVGIKVLATD